jgi:hypothetical protein
MLSDLPYYQSLDMLEHYRIVVMLRVLYAMIRWPLADLECTKTWLVHEIRSVI